MFTGKFIYVYGFIIFSTSIHNIKISKNKLMAPFHLVRAKARREHFPLIYLRNSNIASIIFKNYKTIHIYKF